MPDNKILKNIWNHLSSKELTSSDFNTWKNNIENSEDIKNNVWNYLSDNELTTSSFDDWSKNVFSVPGKPIDPAKETASAGSKDQAVDTDSNLENGSLERPKYNYYEIGGAKVTESDILASQDSERPIRQEDMYEIDGVKYYADELKGSIGKLSIEQYLSRLRQSRKHKIKIHKYKEINVGKDTMTTLYNELDPVLVEAERPDILSYKNKEGGTSYMSKDKYNMLKNTAAYLEKKAIDISDEELRDRAVKRYFGLDDIENRNAEVKNVVQVTQAGPIYAYSPRFKDDAAYDVYLKNQLGEEKYKEYKDYLEDPSTLDLTGTPDETTARREIKSENYQRLLRDVDSEDMQEDLKAFLPGKKFENHEQQIAYFGALETNLKNKNVLISGLKQQYDELDAANNFSAKIDDIENRFEKLNSKYTNGVSRDSDPEDIDAYNKLVEEYEALKESIDASGINTLGGKIDQYREEYNTDFADYVKKSGDLENATIAEAALNMDYTLGTRLALKTEEFIIGGIEGVVGGIADIVASVGESDIINPNLIWYAPTKAARAVSDYATARAEERQKYMAATLPTALTYEDIEKGASFGDMALEMFADNAASTALSLIPVGAGFNAIRGLKIVPGMSEAAKASMSAARAAAWRAAVKKAGNMTSATFFVSAAGNKYNELGVLENNALEMKTALEIALSNETDPVERRRISEQLNIYNRALDRSTAAKAFSSFSHGLIEFGAEKLGTIGYIGRLGDTSKLIGLKPFRKAIKSGSIALTGVGIENLEETVTQLGQNGIDVYVLGDNKSLIDGINKEFFTSTTISSLAISGPSMGQNLYNIFADQVKLNKDIKNNRELFSEYYKLQKEKYSLKNGSAARKKILKRQREILDEASFNSAASIMRLNRLTESQIQEVFELNRKIQQESKTFDEVGAAGMKPGERKTNDILNKSKEKIDALVKRKEEILGVQDRLVEEKLNGFKDLSDVSRAKLRYLLNFQQFHDDLLTYNLKKDTKIYKAETLQDLLPQIANLSKKAQSEIVNAWANGSAAIVNDAVVINDGLRLQQLYAAAKTGMAEAKFAAVAATHELLHLRTAEANLIDESGEIKANFKSAVIGLKNVLAEKLENNEISKEDYDMLIARAKKYEDLNVANPVEELLNLYNDAANLGILNINDFDIHYEAKNLLNSIQEFVFGEGSQFTKFNSSQDVIDYIKKYNKEIRASRLNLGIDPESEEKLSLTASIQEKMNALENQLMDNAIDYDLYESKMAALEKQYDLAEKEEATAPKVEKPVKKTEKATDQKEATDKSKKILDDIGNDPKGFNKNNPKIYEVLDGIIRSKSKVFRTASGNIVNLTKLPGFEMENMVSETITNLVPLINKFNPKKNNSLFGYLNAQLANKMRLSLKQGKVTDQKFTEDVTEVKNLMTEAEEIRQPEKPKYVKIMDADVFGVGVINAITDKMVSTVRVLKNKLNVALGKNQNTSPLISEILSDISTQADINIKKAMGGKKDGVLRKFLLKNKQPIIENLTTTFLMGKDQGNEVLGGLPIAIQKQVDGKFLSYPDWVGKKIDRETTEKRGATAGNQIVRRVPANKISDTDYLSFFLDATGNPLRGRKEALAKELAGELGLELFIEAAESGSGPIFEAFEKNQELLGAALMDNYMSEITKQAERGTIKFSIATELNNKFNTIKNKLLQTKKSKSATARYLQELEDIALKIENSYNINPLDEANAVKVKVVELLQKIVGIESSNRGELAEEEVLNVLKSVERQTNGIISIPKDFKPAGKRGGIADIEYNIKGVEGLQTLEIKLNTYAPLSTIPTEYVSGVGESKLIINFPFVTKEYSDKINEFLQNHKPYKDFFAMLKEKNSEGLLRGKVEESKGKNIIVVNDYKKKNKYGFFYEAKRKITNEYGGQFEAKIELPFEALNEVLAKKSFNTFEIQFMDAGLVEINPETLLKTKNKIDPKDDTVVLRFIINKKDRPSRGGYSVKITPTFFLSDKTRNKILANEDVNLINVNSAKKAFSLAMDVGSLDQNISNKSNETVALGNALNPSKTTKGISVWDFDDTLATTKSNVLYTLPGGITGKLTAEEFAKQGDVLLEQGAEFDFSEFSKVMQGAKGPMFDKAIARNKKFGNDNVYILTARPANSATAIHEFLKGLGLDIKLENIVGLGNSTAKAKADWVNSKVGEGYNDFYFADDAYKNVKAVQKILEVADIKSKVQQAYKKFSLPADPKMLDKEFNLMLERTKGVKAGSVISQSRAAQLSKGKGRFDLFLPPNAEDFQGLLYKFLGKGKQGDADMKFFKENLLDPFNIAENAMSTFRQNLAENLKVLKKELGNIDEDISDESIKSIKEIGFTPDQAVRVFIWNRMGQEIPDLTNQEKAKILSVVRRDASLMRYTRELMKITSQFGGYPPPSKIWFAGNSTSDLYQYANENVRAKYLENWQANADAIFNKSNMTKIEAVYGKDFAKNLKEILRRMKSGSNRPLNLNDTGSKALDYINGSIGTIMFLNMRSAVLQTISAVNFLNWHDNNIFEAGKTLLDPKNFVETFMEIMNSDFLKQRRDGLEINVTEADIATAVEQSKNKAKAMFNALIKFGYKPTQFADSFAIAAGGTSFLINRTKTYEKSGLPYKEAREKAFNDFRAIAEENQQSSRTDRTSNIQASNLGRLVFAFNNTPFQMTRLFKKATLDLINGRGDRKTNISKMLYYGSIQNILFYALQQAYMALLFGSDDEEEIDDKTSRLLNGTLDSILRGSGLPGAIISTAKNTIMEYSKQEAKGDWRADHGKTVIAALNFSPPIGSKVSRIYSGLEGKKYEETTLDVVRNKSKIISAITNIPIDRIVTKIDNMRVATSQPIETWKRAALFLGWDQWSLGVYDDLDAIKASEDKKENKKDRSETMKEVWRKRKEEDKRVRDSIVTARSKMTSKEILEDLRKNRKK